MHGYEGQTQKWRCDCRVQAGQPKRKKEKMNMGVGESFKFLAASSYIRNLALLVRPPTQPSTLNTLSYLGGIYTLI